MGGEATSKSCGHIYGNNEGTCKADNSFEDTGTADMFPNGEGERCERGITDSRGGTFRHSSFIFPFVDFYFQIDKRDQSFKHILRCCSYLTEFLRRASVGVEDVLGIRLDCLITAQVNYRNPITFPCFRKRVSIIRMNTVKWLMNWNELLKNTRGGFPKQQKKTRERT